MIRYPGQVNLISEVSLSSSFEHHESECSDNFCSPDDRGESCEILVLNYS